jgi:hypothetical protein
MTCKSTVGGRTRPFTPMRKVREGAAHQVQPLLRKEARLGVGCSLLAHKRRTPLRHISSRAIVRSPALLPQMSMVRLLFRRLRGPWKVRVPSFERDSKSDPSLLGALDPRPLRSALRPPGRPGRYRHWPPPSWAKPSRSPGPKVTRPRLSSCISSAGSSTCPRPTR